MTQFPSISPLAAGTEAVLCINGQRYLVEILGIAEDAIWTTFPDGESPAEGTGVVLTVPGPEGSLYYHTRVGLRPGIDRAGVVLRRSEASTHLKYRRSWRVHVSLPAELSAVKRPLEGSAVITDLSLTGGMATTRTPFEIGELVTVELKLNGGEPVRFGTRVIHYGPCDDEKGLCRAGFRFVKMSSPTRWALTQYLYRIIREQYAQQLREMYPIGAETAKSATC